MNRTLRITYSLSFLGLLVGMGVWSTGGLQSFQRTEQMTLLNGKLAKAAETHYDAEFPIKRLGTNLWAAMDFKLFNEGRPGVVLGRDQWLFSDEEFKPTAGAEQLMQENLALIRGVRDTLQQHGSQLVLAIIPAKRASIRNTWARSSRPACTMTCTTSSMPRCARPTCSPRTCKRPWNKPRRVVRYSCAPTPTGHRWAPKSSPRRWPRL